MARQHKASLFAFLLLLVSLYSPALAAGGAAMRGDLNENGRIEMFDLLEMLKLIAVGTDDSRLRKLADIDRPEQGKVDIFDLLAMLRLLAGAIEPEAVFFSPTITGANSFSAAGGDTLVLRLESLGDSVDLSEIKIVIGGDTLSALELKGDSLRLVLPESFTGGELRLLVGDDTTNTVDFTHQDRETASATRKTVVSGACGAKVTIPTGAISTDLTVTVNELSPDAARQMQMPLEEGERPVEFGPPGTTFLKPVTIGLPLPEGAGIGKWMEAFCFDEQKHQWESLAVSGIDSTNRLVLAQVGHFSVYKARCWQPSLEKFKEIPLASIPGGGFWMGANLNPFTKHWVELDPFQIGIYEVTRGQYRALTGNSPDSTWSAHWGMVDDADSLPVSEVSWYDAAGFCNALSRSAGLEPCYEEQSWECDFSKNGFRLPTEAEWEYACRAGASTRCYTGDSEDDLGRAAWYYGNSTYPENPNSPFFHMVGRKEPNAFGLYDMIGNVSEWCQDWVGEWTDQPMVNPVRASQGEYKVCAGGCILNGSGNILYSTGQVPSLKTSITGIRVARNAGSRRPVNQVTDTPSLPGTTDPLVVLRTEYSDSLLYTPWGFTMARAEISNDNDFPVNVTWRCRFADDTLKGDYPIQLSIQPGSAWYRRLIVPGPVDFADSELIPEGRRTLYSELEGLGHTDTLELTFSADSAKLRKDGSAKHAIYGATLNGGNYARPKPRVLVHIIGPGTDTYVTSDRDGIFELGGLADGVYLVAPYQLTARIGEAFRTTLSITTLKGGDALGSLSPPRGNIPTIFNGKVNHPYRYFINSGLWQDEYTTDVSSRWTIIDTALALSTSYPKKTVIQGMTMVSLPGGSFIMGENENSAVNPYQPTPEHKVTLDPFQMGAYEVTRIQYSQVMGTPPPAQQVRDKPAYVKHWEEAALYCNRLSRLAGFKECYDTTSWKCDFSKNGFRLPTEAEWEYAARGGRQYPFATFNGQLYHSNAAHSGLSMKQTNMVTQTYMANVSVEVRAGSYIHPPLKDVGSYPPNPFGLYDMCGNTSEICNDPYQTLYYSSSPELNPPGPDNSRIKVSEVYPDGKIIWFYNYVVRGGNNADMPLTFTRYPYGFLLEESRKLLGSEFFTEEPYNNGFRVARRP